MDDLELAFQELCFVQRLIPDAMVSGLKYKPSYRQMTEEGYPPGTTCWYVYCEVDGAIKYCCADTPAGAVNAATAWIKKPIV